MELNEFAADFPELYEMFYEDIRYMIAEKKLTGRESLRDWDDMVDEVVRSYERENFYGYDTEMPTAQQFIPGGRDRDWDRDRDRRDRRRRRFRDFDIRDIIRLQFLRELFDRDRR